MLSPINKSVLSIRFAGLILIFSFVVAGQSSQQAGDSLVLEDFLVEGKRPNFIEGDVQHLRGSDAAPLTLNHQFENGEVIQTGVSGRAEILFGSRLLPEVGPQYAHWSPGPFAGQPKAETVEWLGNPGGCHCDLLPQNPAKIK